MKNLFFILIACLTVTWIHAAPSVSSKREAAVKRQLEKKITVEMFLNAVQKGNRDQISAIADKQENGTFLLTQDSFGNNVFHLAKDADTVQLLGSYFRKFFGKKASEAINQMKKQQNQTGAIPVLAQVDLGHEDAFWALFNDSELEKAIYDAKSVDYGGALAETARHKRALVERMSQDLGGRNFCKAARMNGLFTVAGFCKENAPYLLD